MDMNFRQQPMHVEDTMGFSSLGDFFNFDKNGKIILSTLDEWMKYIYMADIACEVCDTNIERETGGLNKCHLLATTPDHLNKSSYIPVCTECNDTHNKYCIPYTLTSAYRRKKSVKISEDLNIVKLI